MLKCRWGLIGVTDINVASPWHHKPTSDGRPGHLAACLLEKEGRGGS